MGQEEKLIESISNGEFDKAKFILKNANSKNKPLNLNVKNENGHYALLEACSKNNTVLVQLIIEHANYYNIKLELNEELSTGESPLFLACNYWNTEMIKLLMSYANKNNTALMFDGNDIKDCDITTEINESQEQVSEEDKLFENEIQSRTEVSTKHKELLSNIEAPIRFEAKLERNEREGSGMM
ncbi:hypothetical protein PIROE2DRAFT_62978 [Piromyces sp. E2]|nr:hypothetical protein PIROE2DRAFT_62978 [Piromyces sp. E2]|eukprot:OUM60689.1 hypothetical protein PIROE2DRAFT_62978 [Piromyces sp. E2]